MNVRFGDLTFDPGRRQVIDPRGDAVHLTPKAFDLLALLIGAAPGVLAKSAIHERLWPGVFVTDATLVGLVKELRRALDDRDARRPIIRTSHGIGYAFSAALDRRATEDAAHWIVDGERRIPLGEGEHVIGRDPASTVWLEVAGVSRRHARITIRGSSAALEDLGSKNGTMLEEAVVTTPAALRNGSSIRIGPARLSYRRSEAASATESMATTSPSETAAAPRRH